MIAFLVGQLTMECSDVPQWVQLGLPWLNHFDVLLETEYLEIL